MEKWRKIEGKPNYSVSDSGRVRNDKTGRILKLNGNNCGYLQVMLGRKTVPVYVHRAVAKAFVPNPEGKAQVDHINGDKSDNRAENLRWLSPSENCLAYGYRARNEHRKKRVIARKGDREIVFESRGAAAEYFKCGKANIRYGHLYTKGLKKGWVLELAEDIV